MTLLALGDTHGRTHWKTIPDRTDWDIVVFIGDYFDSREGITPQQQIDNFREIITFKQSNPDRVVLLFGNHDYHYLPTVHETYSGYRPKKAAEIGALLTEALEKGELQMVYLHGKYLFSHAGVTQTWLRASGYGAEEPLVGFLNDLIQLQPDIYGFTPGPNDSPFGDDITQSPIWVRPESLEKDALPDYTHVVGHTTVEQMQVTDRFIFIDTLGTSGEFLAIVDGEPEVRKLDFP
jgi:predicted phosphodiesterase